MRNLEWELNLYFGEFFCLLYCIVLYTDLSIFEKCILFTIRYSMCMCSEVDNGDKARMHFCRRDRNTECKFKIYLARD